MADTLDAESLETGAGRLLQEARERQGLSRQDAADGLNLSLGIIEALETDRYDLLPPRTFVKGYLRSYARLVNAPEAGVLAAFEKQQPEPAAERVRLATTGAGTVAVGAGLKWVALLIVVALLAYAGYEMYMTRSSEPAYAGAVDGAAVQSSEPAPVLEALPVPSSQEEQRLPPESIDGSGSEAMEELPPGDAEPAEAVVAPVAEAPAEVAPAEPQDTGTSVLAIDVADESWIEITDAHGVSLHAGLVRGPRILRISGTPPFRLVIGNADRVRLQYDGEPVALEPHSRRNVARFTVPLSP